MEVSGCSRFKRGFQMVRDIVAGGHGRSLNGSPDNIRKHDMSRYLDRVNECLLSLPLFIIHSFSFKQSRNGVLMEVNVNSVIMPASTIGPGINTTTMPSDHYRFNIFFLFPIPSKTAYPT